MTVLVLAEHDNNELNPATLNVLAAAKAIGGDVDLLVAGEDCSSVVQRSKFSWVFAISCKTLCLHVDRRHSTAIDYSKELIPWLQSTPTGNSYLKAALSTYTRALLA